MVVRAPRHQPPSGDAAEWMTLAEARDLLSAASEDVLRYWVELGLLRACTPPDGALRVWRADVLHQKDVQDAHDAFPDEEMTAAELAARHHASSGQPSW
jgi:hypothetical protein